MAQTDPPRLSSRSVVIGSPPQVHVPNQSPRHRLAAVSDDSDRNVDHAQKLQTWIARCNPDRRADAQHVQRKSHKAEHAHDKATSTRPAALFFTLNSHLRAQLNVENVLDARYYGTAHSNNNISPGAPRAARLVVTTGF